METSTSTGWQLPPYEAPVRETAFVALAGMGVVLLWFFSIGMFAFEFGDCFDPTPGVCERLWALQTLHVRVAFALIALDTVLAVLAVLRGRRALPAALLVAGVVTVVLGIMSLQLTRDVESVLPRGYFLAIPGGILLVVGAGWQLLRWRPPQDADKP